jgi:hypothetical protein
MIAALARVGLRVLSTAPELLGLRRTHGGNASGASPAKGGPDVLVVAPEGGIGFHLETSLRVAHLLRLAGFRPAICFCYGSFSRCSVMDMHQLPPEGAVLKKAAVCLHCAATHVQMTRGYGFPTFDLRDGDYAALKRQAHQLVATFAGELLDFTYDGIQFGRAAAMDLVLATKRATLERPPAEIRQRWEQYVETSLLSYMLCGRLLDEGAYRAVLHFNDYSLLLGARLAAEKRRIPVFGLTHAPHLNNDDRRVIIRSEIGPTDFYSGLDAWPSVRTRPLPAEDVKDVVDDIIHRLGATGSHTFSPAKTHATRKGLDHLGLDSTRRLIVAFTSSMDERMATAMTTGGMGRTPRPIAAAFSSQIEWLHELCAYVASQPDVQLAIRVHPREGGGGAAARSGKVVARPSEHLELLRAAFASPRPRCRIFWPDDDVSSYDLMEMADAVTVSWSTIGLEAARLAVPTVACVDGVGPLVDEPFCRVATSPERYFERIHEAIDGEPSIDAWALAIRFYHHVFLGGSIDLRPWVTQSHNAIAQTFRNVPWADLAGPARIVGGVLEGKTTLREERARVLDAHARQSQDAARDEQVALASAAARLTRFLLDGAAGEHGSLSDSAMYACDGSDVRWVYRLQDGHRAYSPMASRLVRLQAVAESDTTKNHGPA